MLGRKKPALTGDDGADSFLPTNGSQDDLLHTSESSARLRGLNESGSSFQGIFRRGGQYEGLQDQGAASPPRLEERGSLSDGEAERPAKEESPLNGMRSGSGSLADGLLSRLNLKEKHAYMPMSSAVAGRGRTDGASPSAKGKIGARSAGEDPKRKGFTPPPRNPRATAGGDDAGEPGADPSKTPTPGPTPARPSPGLRSSAAKLAASIQQGSKRVLGRKSAEPFSPLEDSATESADEAEPPAADPAKQTLKRPSSASPGAGPMRPLLDSADGYEANPSVGLQSPPLVGQRRRASTGSLADTAPDGVGETAAFDIFEPRPEPSAGFAAPPKPGAWPKPPKSSPGGPPSLSEVQSMKGHDALQALRQGTLLRKKWVGSPAAAAAATAAAASKTERLIRCRIENGRVVLHYHHQGVKGLLDKEEVTTSVQRVEVQDGPWRRGDCILLHTGRGLLALEAPDAATHATWMLGLNAALFSCETSRKDALLQAPVRAIPRNPMFIVTPP